MMKKILIVCLIILMTSSVLTSAFNLVENKKYETINIDLKIDNFEIKNNENSHEIIVKDFGFLFIPGKPNLPSKIFSIAIPPETIFMGLDFEIKKCLTLPGFYNVEPVQLPRVLGKENPFVYMQELKLYHDNYNLIYNSDQPYPSSVVEFVRTSGYRKYNLVDVRINPFVYYPRSGKLVYNSEISIYVKYTYPEDYSVDKIMVDYVPQTEKIAEKIILNYNQAKQWYPNTSSGRNSYDFVIITLDSLTSSVTSLVDWETVKGRSVNVVTTSWINTNYEGYDLAEKIRNFLRDKYPSEQWGITDVCIIGHYDDVPMRRCWQDTGYGKPETDFYYAELTKPDSQSWDANGNHKWGEDSDPIDFYGEVNVGRIPWSDPTIVSQICEKTVAYEQNDDESFKKNILLLGAFFWPDTDNAVLMEYKTNPSYHPWMSDWTKTRLYEDAQSSYPCDYDLNYNNVKSVWSSGTYAFVNWAGHGSPDACYEYYPSQPFVDTITCNFLSNDYPAIIFADACSNSDTDEYNIGQAMLKRGGVGFLGSTKVAYGMHAWNNPNSGSSQSFDYYFTTCVTSGEFTQGQAHQWALTKMYSDNLWYY
ncbi:MAG: C25 family cysteine peptidase, partial [Candidatus Thermoplasmatota archaeon]|nr:C25 family cysteine peptidase [Candidatus Thermoplasmatota archaeon]